MPADCRRRRAISASSGSLKLAMVMTSDISSFLCLITILRCTDDRMVGLDDFRGFLH